MSFYIKNSWFLVLKSQFTKTYYESNILQRTEILKIIKYEINYVINKKRDILSVLFPNNYYSIHLIFFPTTIFIQVIYIR